MRKPAIPGKIQKPMGLTNDKLDSHEAGNNIIRIKSNDKTQDNSNIDTEMILDGNFNDDKFNNSKFNDSLQRDMKSLIFDNIQELTGLTDNNNSGDKKAGDDIRTIKSNHKMQGKSNVD